MKPFELMRMDRSSLSFAAIDFETANRNSNSACSLGMVVVAKGEIVREKEVRICPPSSIFEFTHIHGLTWAMVRDSPGFKDAWEEIREFIQGVEFFAAHNASFDRRVLHTLCRENHIEIPGQKFLCTLAISRKVLKIFPSNLAEVCSRLDIPLHHHQALSDARACANIVLQAIGVSRSH
jgi:DNA polymerase-3 subunit epsilon